MGGGAEKLWACSVVSVDSDSFVQELASELDSFATAGTTDWWERYMKGSAQFRGTKMADVRRVVGSLVGRDGLLELAAEDRIALAHACFAQPMSEDELAGVLLLAEHGLAQLTFEHLEDLASPLAVGDIADWNVCDWYCVKVLGPYVVSGDDTEQRCRAIAGWVDAETLWQRRAAAVAFVDHAAAEPELFEGFTGMLLRVAHSNSLDDERWSQTSTGWLLRELSRREPDLVREFIEEHPFLSAEARRNAASYL